MSQKLTLSYVLKETLVRVILFMITRWYSSAEPFQRRIDDEEWWLYKNPPTPSYVSVRNLFLLAWLTPITVFLAFYYQKREKGDFIRALLGVSFALNASDFIVFIVKLTVGRPRPDFFYRCFPNGLDSVANATCDYTRPEVKEGLLSFPSGHSSMSFASLMFVSLYLAGKLDIFGAGRGRIENLLAVITPVFVATLVAISRTCDYHHHWQDVTVGALIGASFAIFAYYQYYSRPGHKIDAKTSETPDKQALLKSNE